MKFSDALGKLFSFFIRGLLLLAPVYLTGSILFSVLDRIDEQFYFYVRGTGLLLLVAVIIFVGFIGSTFIAVPVFRIFEDWIQRLPLVRLIYFSLKDLINAFVGDKKKFDKPVLLTLNKENEIYKLGFITQDDLNALALGKDLIAVYCPHSYAFSGETFLVPATSIKLLNIPTADLMKFIVSGGVSNSEQTEK